MKMNLEKRLFVFFAVLFCCGTTLSGAAFELDSGFVENQLEREPTEICEIEKEKTEIVFKTDVADVEVYINGTFYGRTNLEVKDLLPGLYDVELRLEGCEKQDFSILVRKGFLLTYSLEMKLLHGTVSLYNLSDGCSVFIDNEMVVNDYKNENPMELDVTAGRHNLLVKKFGFEDFTQPLNVSGGEAKNEVQKVQVELIPLDFDFSNFTVDKKSFNPDRKGKKGICKFSFDVTADGELTASIYNQKNELCWSCRLNNFSKKQQVFNWDGTENQKEQTEQQSEKNEKIKAADGVYTVILSSEKKELTVQISVKR